MTIQAGSRRRFLALDLDDLATAHVGAQHLGHGDGAVGILVVLHDGGHGAARGQAGAVQGVQVPRTLEVLGVAVLDVGAARLATKAPSRPK